MKKIVNKILFYYHNSSKLERKAYLNIFNRLEPKIRLLHINAFNTNDDNKVNVVSLKVCFRSYEI